jgi:hypothetical protein
MNVSSAPSAPSVASATSGRRRKRTAWAIGLLIPFLALAAIGVFFINKNWPYRYRNVKPLLENIFASKITIDHYHRTYFPHPGFVATQLTLRRNSAPNLPPLGSTQDLIVQGRWIDLLLLRRRIWLVDVKGLHIVIPPLGSPANREDFPPGSSADFTGPTTAVTQLYIHGATLDMMGKEGGRYSLPIHQLIIRNLQQGHAVPYWLDMQTSKPMGDIHSSGSFGPLDPKNLGATPLSGDFTYTSVNLHDIGAIRGMLSATGHFQGRLADIEAQATSNTPDFAVGHGKPTPLAASVQTTINGLNADLVIHRVDAMIGKTSVHVEGTIAGSPKVTNLDMAVSKGRTQDILRPFIEDQVPITGAASLHGHVYLAPSHKGTKFLQRLRVNGSFDAPAERLTKQSQEQELTAFSQRVSAAKPAGGKQSAASAGPADPTGQDPATSDNVLLSLNGPVEIRDGVLSTQGLTFQIPGAMANLNGSYNLRNKSVQMTGNLAMQSNISHAATGYKSWLLVPFIPLFKKSHAGAVIPIAITGKPGQYKVSQNLLHTK